MSVERSNLTTNRQADARRKLHAGEKAKAQVKKQGERAHLPVDPQAAAYRIPQAIIFTGFSRSELYRRLNSGELVGRKAGRALLIDGPSLRSCVENLPVARFGQHKDPT